MWFDARAKLAEIVGDPPCDFRDNRDTSPSCAPRVASVATVATPLTEAARARAAALPTAPPTCAACGLADWHVSVTDTKRRTLHVACWRPKQGGRR